MKTSNRSFIMAICIALAICFTALMATTASADEGIEANVRSASIEGSTTGINQGIPVETDPDADPRRDDPGDVLAEYEVPYNNTFGLAWDPDHNWMWGVNHTNPPRLYAVDPENGEVMANFEVVDQILGLFYLDGVLYAGGHRNHPNTIYRYDTEGNVDPWDMPFSVSNTYIASDGEFLFTHNFGTTSINVINLDNLEEVVAVIDYSEAIGEVHTDQIEWVSAHPEGQLWMSGGDHFYQFFLDGDWNVELVQDFEKINGASGIAHDGENLWYGPVGDDTWYVIDDGVAEIQWLAYDPAEGEVEADGQQEVTVTIDCNDLVEGDYDADMTFATNDPDDEDVIVNVLMHVAGAPNIEVTWSEEYGYNPDVPEESLVDWNLAHIDVYAGFSYDVTVVVTNTGSAALEIDDIFCENQRFTADPIELVLDHDQSEEITLTFQTEADDPGDFEATMVFVSNDPDNEMYAIDVRAMPQIPPDVRIEPGAIEDDLFVGRVEEYTITVFNDGEAPLRFTVTHEIISEPERDEFNRYPGSRQGRQLRSTAERRDVAPRRRNGSTSLFR